MGILRSCRGHEYEECCGRTICWHALEEGLDGDPNLVLGDAKSVEIWHLLQEDLDGDANLALGNANREMWHP